MTTHPSRAGAPDAPGGWQRARISAAAALVLAGDPALGAALAADELTRSDPAALLLDTTAVAASALAGGLPRARLLRGYTEVLASTIPRRRGGRRRLRRTSLATLATCATAVYGHSPATAVAHLARRVRADDLAVAAAVVAAACFATAAGGIIPGTDDARAATLDAITALAA